LLQEEVAPPVGRQDHRKLDFRSWSKQSAPNPLPLPPPPQATVPKSEPNPKHFDHSIAADSKLGALKAYRRARGLCEKCAEKWHHGHTCSATVQLHVLQEVWDLLSDTPVSDAAGATNSTEESILMSLSPEAVSGSSTKRSMQFIGHMCQQDILILVDSGSTNSFINQTTVLKLGLATVASVPIRVQVANGGMLVCSTMVPQASWSIQDCSFLQDLQVLTLPNFDLILGMDWLEHFSPMRIHWQHKWISIPYSGKQVVLYGYSDRQPTDILLHITAVHLSDASSSGEILHPAISNLLSQFSPVFSTPSTLPPVRTCDHSIPLIQGATPVNIRPYRYPPSLKDEIERQVTEMLKAGIIRPSASEFCSPVLLVRKKDGSFRFCVDYRYLNALTLKWKFPIPVLTS
jgi:hypothetical protein